MKISLHNRQRLVRLNPAGLRKLTRWLMERVRAEAFRNSFGGIAVVCADDRGMASANAACFGKNEPTDVLSLSYAPVPGESRRPGAEILVNVERALAVSGKGIPGQAELALYLAHGLHHLAGARDDTRGRKKRMLRQEQAWLRAAAREGLVRNLWRVAGCSED